MRVVSTFLALLIAASIAGRAEQAPATGYFGTWTCDPARSDLGPAQFTIAERNGRWTFADDVLKTTYTFQFDGRGYETPDDSTATWTARSADAWDVAYEVKGKNVATERFTLSSDGQVITSLYVFGGTKPVEATFTRSPAERSGLSGTWRGKFVPPPFTLEIQPDGDDGLICRAVDGFEVKARIDGKPYPMTGPLVARPLTASFTRPGRHTLRTVQKEGDKVMLDAVISVSEDGRTLTTAGVGEGGVKRRWVFDRVK